MDLKPIGSVVRIKDAQDKVMIIGHSRRNPMDHTQIYDYLGVKYPEGYDGRRAVLFNDDMIDESFNSGYQDQDAIFNTMVAGEKLDMWHAEADKLKKRLEKSAENKVED